MPHPARLALSRPLRFIAFSYTFLVQSILICTKRIFLPHFPVYQSLRVQLARAYLAAANLHLPDIVYHTPVTHCSQQQARRVGKDWTGYIIPGDRQLSEFKSDAERSPTACPKSAVVLYAHGGGYARGEARMYLTFMQRWVAVAKAKGIDLVFISVEYPLSTESPHPSQRNAFMQGYRWLLAEGIDPRRIMFMGDSAGAALSIMVGLEALLLELPQPAGSVLLSPWLDYSLESFEGGNAYVLSDYLVHANEVVPKMIGMFLGPNDGRSPDVNPLFRKSEELRGLNPQLILSGGGEFAIQDARGWTKMCAEAGVDHKTVIEKGQLHIFALGHSVLSPAIRTKTDETIVSWIDRCVM